MLEQTELPPRFELLALEMKDVSELEKAFREALRDCGGQDMAKKHCYEAFLASLARLGCRERLETGLKEMAAVVPPDAVTYGIVVNALGPKELRFAGDLLRHSPVELTLAHFNAMLKLCGKAKDLKAAHLWMERLYSQGLKPNILSFNNLLSACAMVGSLTEAREVLRRMEELSIGPDGFSYLWLIKAAGQQGGAVAEDWLRKALRRTEPQVGHYNAVLRAYLAEVETKETPRHVERLALEMQRSVKMNAETWLSRWETGRFWTEDVDDDDEI